MKENNTSLQTWGEIQHPVRHLISFSVAQQDNQVFTQVVFNKNLKLGNQLPVYFFHWE